MGAVIIHRGVHTIDIRCDVAERWKLRLVRDLVLVLVLILMLSLVLVLLLVLVLAMV